MKFFKKIQEQLEETYGAKTGLDVRDFVRSTRSLNTLGELLVEQDTTTQDLNIALLFDRDILAAFESSEPTEDPISNNSKVIFRQSAHERPETQIATSNSRALSVSFEEISHFVYLSFNHNRGRNITRLELEIQSEVDRILLAFHGPLNVKTETRIVLLSELLEKAYPANDAQKTSYELSRQIAANFIRIVGLDPAAWTHQEFKLLREFFHNDLPGKISLSKNLC